MILKNKPIFFKPIYPKNIHTDTMKLWYLNKMYYDNIGILSTQIYVDLVSVLKLNSKQEKEVVMRLLE